MTMQVGMVGTDGVLIASDTKWHVSPQIPTGEFWRGGRYSFGSQKIKLNYERGIAVSQALNMEVAERVADGIISRLPSESFDYPQIEIEKIGEEVLKSAAPDRREAHCIIAICRPDPRLFLFTFALCEGQRTAVCRRMENFVFGGDNVNPAICWAEQFYEKRPIKMLIPLAAHLIVSAGKMSSGSIGGLEVVYCDAEGIHRLSDQSIAALHSKAEEWNRTIAGLFRDYRQEFIDAPNVIG